MYTHWCVYCCRKDRFLTPIYTRLIHTPHFRSTPPPSQKTPQFWVYDIKLANALDFRHYCIRVLQLRKKIIIIIIIGLTSLCVYGSACHGDEQLELGP